MNSDAIYIASRLKAYLDRRGHGALQRFANESGLSRITVGKIRDGVHVDEKSLTSAEAALNSLETGGRGEGGAQTEDVFDTIARDLESLAAKMRSKAFPPDLKVKQLRRFIEIVHEEIQAASAQLQSPAQRGQ